MSLRSFSSTPTMFCAVTTGPVGIGSMQFAQDLGQRSVATLWPWSKLLKSFACGFKRSNLLHHLGQLLTASVAAAGRPSRCWISLRWKLLQWRKTCLLANKWFPVACVLQKFMKLTALESENFSWLGCGPCFKFNNFWCPCSFLFFLLLQRWHIYM